MLLRARPRGFGRPRPGRRGAADDLECGSRLPPLALLLLSLAPGRATGDSEPCPVPDFSVSFPEPTVKVAQHWLTPEQAWMSEHWPDYHNGVALGGLFVMEDWMFYKSAPPFSVADLQIEVNTHSDQLAWSEALLKRPLEDAYATMDCHLRNFYSDKALDQLAEFGINAIRLPVGYWMFDDPGLYVDDSWVHLPSGSGDYGSYGVNPDGFITPGIGLLTDFVIKLWSRNMKVLIDMHALPGCSTPHQSYAGMDCEAKAPNFWNGQASAGVSGGHKVQRNPADPKTWSQFYYRLVLERVVPWIKFMEARASGAVIGYEVINEPDLMASDAQQEQVRTMNLYVGKMVNTCLGPEMASRIFVGISYAAQRYTPQDINQDYMSTFAGCKKSFVTDIHHYYAWAGCLDAESKTFSLQCACESNIWGSQFEFEDGDWAAFMKGGAFGGGWRFYVGEWTSHNGPATACQNDLPTREQAAALWRSQKWNFLNQYLQYQGKVDGGRSSSFVGDFYWNGRMGYNWNANPASCAPDTSTEHYEDFSSWDWSFLRLIALGLAKPLSQLDWTPYTLAQKRAATCVGTLLVHCAAGQQQATVRSSVLSSEVGSSGRIDDAGTLTAVAAFRRLPLVAGLTAAALLVSLAASALLAAGAAARRYQRVPAWRQQLGREGAEVRWPPNEEAASTVDALSRPSVNADIFSAGEESERQPHPPCMRR